MKTAITEWEAKTAELKAKLVAEETKTAEWEAKILEIEAELRAEWEAEEAELAELETEEARTTE